MNVLVLEDEAYRQKLFRRALIGTACEIVSTASECIRLLSEKNWDFLFLDHDLDMQQMVPSGPGTGYEVACWLEANPERKPDNVVIHSLNNVGGPRMAQAIPGAVWLPGCWGTIEVREGGLLVRGH